MKFNEQAVEEWAKEFAKAETVPINPQNAMPLAYLVMYSATINKDKELQDELNNTDTWGNILMHRIKARKFSYDITTAAPYLIDSVIRNWGDVAMYAAYLQYVAVRDNVKTFDITDLIRIFPRAAFPTDTERERLWNLQKIDREDRERLALIIDNALDYPTCYKSLFSTDSNGEQ